MYRQCMFIRFIVYIGADFHQERNVILSRAYEYRQPPASVVKGAVANENVTALETSIKLDMTSRFLGLVVVPGQEIMSIEVEEQLDTPGTVGREEVLPASDFFKLGTN